MLVRLRSRPEEVNLQTSTVLVFTGTDRPKTAEVVVVDDRWDDDAVAVGSDRG